MDHFILRDVCRFLEAYKHVVQIELFGHTFDQDKTFIKLLCIMMFSRSLSLYCVYHIWLIYISWPWRHQTKDWSISPNVNRWECFFLLLWCNMLCRDRVAFMKVRNFIFDRDRSNLVWLVKIFTIIMGYNDECCTCRNDIDELVSYCLEFLLFDSWIQYLAGENRVVMTIFSSIGDSSVDYFLYIVARRIEANINHVIIKISGIYSLKRSNEKRYHFDVQKWFYSYN